MFPVEVCYLRSPCTDYVETAVQTVFDIHMKVRFCPDTEEAYAEQRIQEPIGDVLVFLTGREEIEQAIQMVADRSTS